MAVAIPMEFQHASEDFEAFLRDARDISGLSTRNQTYTMAQAVLVTFRRRLSVIDDIRFANALPPVLRVLFVTDWDPEEPQREFRDPADLVHEVLSLRCYPNFSPQTAIRDVATALRRHVEETALDDLLGRIPPGAAQFWAVT
ncbi:DUF2267 domain-containing protein [Microvirga aerophila]|uniref:DUF2267 domain-containing protein n=1 Tax=Microvirga aerophila TaxID=670291 RepID=A0A512BZX0_9HYPH|nr:DUF2267 domain-containing protein [Microvirga aerophila]GEO17493.1 hypothetical protein MAE02_51890 [Microvirga aerophila]